ncbi:uncharacterized protein [Phyllobates terribilis]|uniref:uncharacterized protein isoform X2 n=1 Tax=Phyllobates terribilis TaxID=111132 RepID=UPI003CCA8472
MDECELDAAAASDVRPMPPACHGGYLYVKPETVPKIHRGEELCVNSDLYRHRRKRPLSGDIKGKDDGCRYPNRSLTDTRRSSSSRACKKQDKSTTEETMAGESPANMEELEDLALTEEQDDSSETVEDQTELTSAVYTCGECGDCFEEPTEFLAHKEAHTEERNSVKHDIRLTPTREIGGSRIRRRKHITCASDKSISKRTQTEPKAYVCKECGKSFTQNASLIVHRRTHTGERPHTCKTCLKSFISGSYLVMHQRVHTGERPYGCNDCGKRFISSSNLIIHQRVHTGEKPYLCTECGKCFGHSSHLVRHQKVHTGERPFTCAECGKSFSRSSHLVRHQTIHMRGPANSTV